jgi:hypothetical protein
MRFRWIAAAAVMAPATAAADDVTARSHVSELDRPHTVAELEAGVIVLPDAPISAANRGGNTLLPGPFRTVGNGDATVQTGVHLLYRATPEWSVGAGAIFAPNPTTDPNASGGLAKGLQRSHSRSYLFLGGEGRFTPLRLGSFEGWIGLTAGAIIVADRFTTNSAPTEPSLLGTNEVTVDSGGFAFGLQTGAEYLFLDRLTVGLTLRADQWFLPSQRSSFSTSSCDAFGECPTLTGRVAAFELGLSIGYHVPL